MNFVYPAIFKLEDGSYWVSFPDLEGCFSQGDTAEEAMVNAQEAMELYLEPDSDEPIFPKATSLEDVRLDGEGFVSLVVGNVKVDMGKSVRKNLTIPAWLNSRAEEAGVNFSQTLQEALRQKLSI